MAENKLRAVQGTEDILPDQWGWWRRLYGEARRQFELYGYGKLRTPLLEHVPLFEKGTGETTDIVQKQMYVVDPEEGGGITLRPEGTPPAVRTYLNNSMHKQERFRKFYYMGPMFRRERPQKGRLRQFHQAGVEAIGSGSPLLDAETILLAIDIYRGVGLERCEVKLNSIGCDDCRPDYRDTVHEQLAARRDELCEDCQNRLDRNVFRVLDCKEPQCRAIASELPVMTDYLCEDCLSHYTRVKGVLDDMNADYSEDPHLVRGLDYYTRTVYEITHPGLGARDTICGGGRYDDLVEMLGGPDLPCVGFAMGVEASILAMEDELGDPPDTSVSPDVFSVAFEDEAREECFRLTHWLRREGVAAEMDYEARSAKAQMRMADSNNARLCFLMGGRELENEEVLIKEMAGGEQWNVPRDEVLEEVKKFLAEHPETD